MLLAGLEHLDDRYLKAVGYATKSKKGNGHLPKMVLLGDIAGDNADDVARVAAEVALAFVARRPESGARVLGAGTLLGLGVAFMHYLGMYGMRFPGFIVWSVPTVLLSVGIAVAAASAALWLCDLHPDTLDMDPARLRALCSERTLAVLPTLRG